MGHLLELLVGRVPEKALSTEYIGLGFGFRFGFWFGFGFEGIIHPRRYIRAGNQLHFLLGGPWQLPSAYSPLSGPNTHCLKHTPTA